MFAPPSVHIYACVNEFCVSLILVRPLPLYACGEKQAALGSRTPFASPHGEQLGGWGRPTPPAPFRREGSSHEGLAEVARAGSNEGLAVAALEVLPPLARGVPFDRWSYCAPVRYCLVRPHLVTGRALDVGLVSESGNGRARKGAVDCRVAG